MKVKDHWREGIVQISRSFQKMLSKTEQIQRKRLKGFEKGAPGWPISDSDVEVLLGGLIPTRVAIPSRESVCTHSQPNMTLASP
jgi:hypothetical protein